MADNSIYEEGINAYEAGVDLVSTTLNGYTPYTKYTSDADYELVSKLSQYLLLQKDEFIYLNKQQK